MTATGDAGLPVPDGAAFVAAYEDSPVLDMLAEAFPQAPNPDDYRTPGGGFDEEGWGEARDDFMSEALDLAVKVTRLSDLEARLVRAEVLRDGLAELLRREPIPQRPFRDDYVIRGHGPFTGMVEDAEYDLDHAAWGADAAEAAIRREQALQRLLWGEGGGRQPLPSAGSPQREQEGAVLDEIALTLRTVPDDILRERLTGILARVGRSVQQIGEPATRRERRLLLNDMLHQRQEALAPNADAEQQGPTSPMRAASREHPPH